MENNKFSSNLFITIVFSIIALFIIKHFNISYPITITTTNKSTEMAVVGEGKIEVTPDTAYIDAGITIDKASSVDEAQKLMDGINNKIVAGLRSLGIEKSDIKTSNYSIYPNYKYENNDNRVDGYNGNATITIKVRNPQAASNVIESVTKSGANQIHGSRFVVDKPEIYREQAREAAIKNAKDQAQKIAKNLGIKLGKITNIIETTPDNNNISYSKSFLPMSGGGGAEGSRLDYQQGSQTLTSVVTLYFEKQ